MDRLREVEGATSSGRAHATSKQSARHPAPAHQPEEKRSESGRRTARYFILAGAVAASAILIVWGPWKTESPKRLPGRQAGLTTESPEVAPWPGRLETRLASAPSEEEALTASQDVQDMPGNASLRDLLHDPVILSKDDHVGPKPPSPFAEAGSLAQSGESTAIPRELPPKQKPSPEMTATDAVLPEVPAPTEDLASGATATSTSAQLPQEEATSPSPPQAPLAELAHGPTLTAEEDQRVKSILLSLKVTGVYRDASGYLAFIEGRKLQKGDKIGDIEIAQIASQRITFAFKGKRYNLRLR